MIQQKQNSVFDLGRTPNGEITKFDIVGQRITKQKANAQEAFELIPVKDQLTFNRPPASLSAIIRQLECRRLAVKGDRDPQSEWIGNAS